MPRDAGVVLPVPQSTNRFVYDGGLLLAEVNSASGPLARENPFQFSTKYQDDETDLIYFGQHYCSASLGRWLNRDPIEEAGG